MKHDAVSFLAKNDVVVCPGCKVSLYRCVEDIPGGDGLYAEDFVSLEGTPGLKNGEETRCPHCQDFWVAIGFHGLMVFTQDGWKSECSGCSGDCRKLLMCEEDEESETH